MSALLPTRTVEKVWGRDVLPPPFSAPAGQRIGEIWFEPPPDLPELLVKYIFASEKLSIQTHPDDDQAEAAGLGRQGKEECWLVIAADEGATLGIGFREELSQEAMRAAALDGSIEELLVWHEVSPGDFFVIPANTVHAIGGGVSLIEVQQNSDITYRLYDYGRPRELHLDAGMAVADGGPHPAALRLHVPMEGSAKNAAAYSRQLLDGRYFTLDWLCGEGMADQRAKRHRLLIPVEGEYGIDGEAVGAGECALVAPGAAIAWDPAGCCLVATPKPR